MLDVLEYVKKDQEFKNLKHMLVFGEDVYFIQYFEKLIAVKFKTRIYWADELDYDTLKGILFSKNIFGKELIIIKNAKDLLGFLKNKKFNLQTNNILMLQAYENLTDKDIKIFKDIFGDLEILYSKQKSKNYLKNLILKKFKKDNLHLSEDNVNYIIDTIGADSLNLKNETDKLILIAKDYALDTNIISKVIVREPKEEMFSIMDAILKNDMKIALRIFYDTIKLGQHPLVILGFIIKQFVNLYLVFKMNKDFEDACKILGIQTPFQKNILKKQMDMVNANKLMNIIHILKKADMDIKYYFKDPYDTLEKLILDIGIYLKNG